MVDEVGDPPLKFLKAAERVKLVSNTAHRLGQGGILGLKATFVSTLPLLHFFLAKIRIKLLLSFCRVKFGYQNAGFARGRDKEDKEEEEEEEKGQGDDEEREEDEQPPPPPENTRKKDSRKKSKRGRKSPF
jgi:hypothetical protein